METNQLISINTLLREVTVHVGDPEYSMGFTRGWYESIIDECFGLLKFSIKFTGPDEPPMDVALDPLTLQFAKPKDVYDIKQVFAWDGVDLSSAVPVFWKRRMVNESGGGDFTAQVTDNNGGNANVFAQPFKPPVAFFGANVLWWSIQNGILMFSRGCASYKLVRLIYSGIADLGELECIPRIFHTVIKDFVKWRFADAMSFRDDRYFKLAAQAKANLEVSWEQAETFVKEMHTAQRENLKVYHGRMNH